MDLTQALHWAEQSLVIAQEHEMKLEEGDVRRVLGQVHCARGEYQAAERELGASLTLLESLDSQYQVGQTLYQLARLHAATNQRPLARQEASRALGIFEQLDAQIDLKAVQALRDVLGS